MRPTLQYIKEKFDYYNKLCFDGQLQRPPIRLNTRYGTMGITKAKFVEDHYGGLIATDLSIELSVRRDLSEEEYIDTLLHEMIHYHILSKNMVDDSPHGSLFKNKMNEISSKYGIKITIKFDPTDEELVRTKTRLRYVCTASLDDGHMGVSVVAKNKLFDLWNVFPLIQGVEDVKWYVSNRSIFEKFPVAVTPSLIIIDADKLHHYLTGAKELENNGQVIRVKQ